MNKEEAADDTVGVVDENGEVIEAVDTQSTDGRLLVDGGEDGGFELAVGH